MVTIATPAQQLKSFIDKFDPAIRTLIRSVRKELRKRFAHANELVYDNYNFFVIGYSSTERASDSIVSLVAGPKGVSLCFIYGAGLPDPKKILRGSGNQTRFVRLDSAGELRKAEFVAMMKAAIAKSKTPLPRTGGGKLIIKSVSTKQRPRRRTV